jgi:hypothetical protein
MKMLAEYLENAIRFEKMAAEEKDAKLKADFEKQPRLSQARGKESERVRPQNTVRQEYFAPGQSSLTHPTLSCCLSKWRATQNNDQ